MNLHLQACVHWMCKILRNTEVYQYAFIHGLGNWQVRINISLVLIVTICNPLPKQNKFLKQTKIKWLGKTFSMLMLFRYMFFNEYMGKHSPQGLMHWFGTYGYDNHFVSFYEVGWHKVMNPDESSGLLLISLVKTTSPKVQMEEMKP